VFGGYFVLGYDYICDESRTKFTKHRQCEARVANSHIPLGAQRFADNGICLSGSRTALDIINVNFVRDEKTETSTSCWRYRFDYCTSASFGDQFLFILGPYVV